MLLTSMLASFAAICVHGYLTLQHYQLKAGLQNGQSICNINQTFNCDSVALSQYSTFLGAPVALWGIFANAILLLLVLISYFSLTADTPRNTRYAFYLSSLIAFTSIIMGSISQFALSTYCLFCIAAYILSFITTFCLWKATQKVNLAKDLKDLVGSQRWVAGLGVSIVALTFLTHFILHDNYFPAQLQPTIIENINNWKKGTSVNFNFETGLKIPAKEKLRFQIVEFADFLCPHCKHAGPTLQAYVAGRPDAELIFKFFPLDGTCNPAIEQKGDGLRCRLAYAVYCAQKIANKGWEADHWIFEHQEDYFRGDEKKLAEKMLSDLGLNSEDFNKCVSSDEAHSAVVAQAQEGKDQVKGTPAIFVNGKKLDGAQYFPILDAAYKEVVK